LYFRGVDFRIILDFQYLTTEFGLAKKILIPKYCRKGVCTTKVTNPESGHMHSSCYSDNENMCCGSGYDRTFGAD
jgi:hypothetical protein